jgi:uncharacterized caspase-like protein
MRRIPLVIAAAVALALPSNTAARRPPLLRCADARYSYVEHGTRQHVDATAIRARSTGCQTARSLARRYAIAYRNDYGTPSQLMGFNCRWTRYGTDVGGAHCRKDSASVSFYIYDSSPYH